MLLVILSTFFGLSSSASSFWYGDTRGPLVYDSLDYGNFSVRVILPIDEGPGQNLMFDPINPKNRIFPGNTINRASFVTQFVLDMEFALGISRNRVFVTNITRGTVHFSWEATSVIVDFVFFERKSNSELTLLESVAKLTAQIQTPGSPIYVGTNSTSSIDPIYGLEVKVWDVSLRLLYSIEVIGGKSVIDGYYLNQGGLGLCDSAYIHVDLVQYCEFERFFEDDISKALSIAHYRVQILFVKASALDSCLIHFRILPPMRGTTEDTTELAIANLLDQVTNQTSDVYFGNVTIRIDPAWGVSETSKTPRVAEALFTYKYYDYDPRHLTTSRVPIERRPQSLVNDYSRCKANRRCNWGVVGV
jgi:hypothetical protein